MDDNAAPDELVRARAEEVLLAWLKETESNPVVDAIVEDTESDAQRWFVRVKGDAKDVYSVWFELGQRTLRYETYVLPAPEENHAAFYEQLLRRNDGLRELAFTIGDEQAIFLKGRIELGHVDAQALDRILGTVYDAVERCFEAALKVGFASRFIT